MVRLISDRTGRGFALPALDLGLRPRYDAGGRRVRHIVDAAVSKAVLASRVVALSCPARRPPRSPSHVVLRLAAAFPH